MLFECSNWSATPGKLLSGLKVARSDGSRMHVDTALSRFLLRTAPAWPALLCSFLMNGITPLLIGGLLIASVLIVIIDPLCVLFTGQRQALHDIMAGTRVIRAHPCGVLGAITTLVVMGVVVIINIAVQRALY